MASSGRGRRVFNATVLVIGVVALCIVVQQLGWAGVRRAIVGIGPWFAVLAAIDVVSVGCDAGAVYAFLRRDTTIPYRHVLVAQWSGLAINRLTPGNSAGEPVKVSLLVDHVPTDIAISAIVMFNLATYGVAIAAIVVGAPLALIFVDLSARVRLAVILATGSLVLLVIAFVWLARRGVLRITVAGLRRIRVVSKARAMAWTARVAPIDLRVRELGRTGRRGIAMAGLSRLLNSAGTVVVMYACDVQLTAALVITMLSIGILVTSISNVIPLGLGIADSTNYALYGALGSTGPVGLLFTMVNRTRTVVLALLGLAVMAIASVRTSPR